MGAINIGIDENGKLYVHSQFEKKLNANEEELLIAEHFVSAIARAKPDVSVSLERRSENYLSLCVSENDFLRFKYSERAKWISIDTTYLNLSEDDLRFAAQKNKRQRHWKAIICDLSELADYDELVVMACR